MKNYEDATIYYKVRIKSPTPKDIPEITEHLSRNAYTFDTNGKDAVFIYEEEIEYLMTILDERGFDYEVE